MVLVVVPEGGQIGVIVGVVVVMRLLSPWGSNGRVVGVVVFMPAAVPAGVQQA